MPERPRSRNGDRLVRRRLLVLLAWTCVVWGHSLVAGPGSQAESGRVVRLLEPILQVLGVTGEHAMSFVVRKGGHLSEYAILAILAMRVGWALPDGARLRALPIAWVVLVSVVDETIQLFVPGRSGQATDVLIDLTGAGVGALVAWLVGRRVTRTSR